MGKRLYTAPDGAQYPLTEAKYDMAFRVYKSDRNKSAAGDPHNCLVAKGVRRHKDVLDVYIGQGLDAYVIFKGEGDEGPYAVHFILGTTVRKIIDGFDRDRKAVTMQVILKKPTAKRTLEARRVMGKTRNGKIKAGTVKVKPRAEAPRAPRISRLGVANRPRPRISESGSVNATMTKEDR